MRVLVSASCLLIGCGPSGAAPAKTTAASAAVEPVASPPSAPVRSAGVVRIEPYTSPAPLLSIAKPGADESLSADAARSQPVVLDDGGYLEENPGARIALVLDGSFVRDVSDVRTPLMLGAIDLMGTSPGRGEHLLAAVAVGPRGEAARFGAGRETASAVRRFFVGTPAERTTMPVPALLLLAPRGTYNGRARADSALLDFVILGGELGADGLSLRVRITGPRGASDAVLSAPGPYALHGLESGDHRFDLELRRSEGPLAGPWARAGRTVTVNLDGPAR